MSIQSQTQNAGLILIIRGLQYIDKATIEIEGEVDARLVDCQSDVAAERSVFRIRYPKTWNDDIRWYLEQFPSWPYGIMRERAGRIERTLSTWGGYLFDEVLRGSKAAISWCSLEHEHPRALYIVIDGASGGALQSLPWELLADNGAFLSERGITVVRCSSAPGPRDEPWQPLRRVLFVVSRPEESGVPLLDPRLTLAPSLAALGAGPIKTTVLTNSSYTQFERILQAAKEKKEPYDVIHFDGHGEHIPGTEGFLLFEQESGSAENGLRRGAEPIRASRIAQTLSQHNIKLVLLIACESGALDPNLATSVASCLLSHGIPMVVGMTHKVHVAAARIFTGAFYRALCRGCTIGFCFSEAQRCLRDHRSRPYIGTQGLDLIDWFLPAFFSNVSVEQEQQEQQSVAAGPSEPMPISLTLRGIPARPEMVGRFRELLTLARLLERSRSVALVGTAGQGKSLLAIEAARWLHLTGSLARIAVVSLRPNQHDVPDMLREICAQFEIEWSSSSPVAELLSQVEAVCRGRPALVILDAEQPLNLADEREDPWAAGQLRSLLDLFRQYEHIKVILVSTTISSLGPETDLMHLSRMAKEEARQLAMVYAPQSLTAEELEGILELTARHAESIIILTQRWVSGYTIEDVGALFRGFGNERPGTRARSLVDRFAQSVGRLKEQDRVHLRIFMAHPWPLRIESLEDILVIDRQAAIRLRYRWWEAGVCDVDGLHVLPNPVLASLLPSLPPSESNALRRRWMLACLSLLNHLSSIETSHRTEPMTGEHLAHVGILAGVSAASIFLLSPEESMYVLAVYERLVARSRNIWIFLQIRALRRRLNEGDIEVGYASVEAGIAEITALLDKGEIHSALPIAITLHDHCIEDARVHGLDLGGVKMLLGRIYRHLGEYETSRAWLESAAEVYARLDDEAAIHQIQVTHSERAQSFHLDGRLEEAIALYEVCIQEAERKNWSRDAAVDRVNLASALVDMGQLLDARQVLSPAMKMFRTLDEPAGLISALHAAGAIEQRLMRFEEAEVLYRNALALEIASGRRAEQAATLNQIGRMLSENHRHDEALQPYREAGQVYAALGLTSKQAIVQDNLAISLLKIGRIPEARAAIEEAIHLKEPHGIAPQPWKSFAILQHIELVNNRQDEALSAWTTACQWYRTYRIGGGEPMDIEGQFIFRLADTALNGDVDCAHRLSLTNEAVRCAPWFDALIQILKGERNPVVTQNPMFSPQASVELELLQAALSSRYR